MSLHEILLNQIRAHGPITVHDYMQLCLQHPEHGYYRKALAVGAKGDFITAPEISQIFGDLLAMWLIHAWQVSGQPERAALVELGPGRGTLAADVLRILKKNPLVQDVFSLHLVESNQTLREEQARKLWRYEPEWHDTIETLPTSLPLFLLANEFFDALPIRQFVGEVERCITLHGEALAFTPEGPITHEDCPQGEALMRALAARLKRQRGCALVVDYGYDSRQPLVASRQKDTLQAVKNHRYHPVLNDPGEADLTAHVDFGRLAEVARECGLEPHGPVTQGAFLGRIGGDLWLQKLLKTATPSQQKSLEEGWLRLVSPDAMGTLFKVLAITAKPCILAGMR